MTLFSSHSIKTIIITLQGVQAIFLSDLGIYTSEPKESMAYYLEAASLGNLFAPLALFGLLRLFAAFWITADFGYVAIEDIPLGITMSRAWAISADSLQIQPSGDIEQLFSHTTSSKSNAGESRFQHRPWWSRLFRFVYISIYAAFCLVAIASTLMTQAEDVPLSATGAMGIAILLPLSSILVICIYTYYAAQHACMPTIIPCINKTWYKLLTVLLYLALIAHPIVSGIETRRTPCGRYTTSLLGAGDDSILCPGLVYLGPDSRPGPFGLVSDAVPELNGLDPGHGNYTMTYFTGSCQGVSGEVAIVQNITL